MLRTILREKAKGRDMLNAVGGLKVRWSPVVQVDEYKAFIRTRRKEAIKTLQKMETFEQEKLLAAV